MNKKIVFVGLAFVLFAGVFLSANSANAAFWDWFRAGDDNVAAVAKAARVALNVQKQGNGVIKSDDGKINCGSDCKEIYYSGGSIYLYATSAKGFAFDKWTGNACGDSIGIGISTSTEVTIGQCQVNLNYNKNKTITATAHFKKTSGSSSSKSSRSRSSKSTSSSNLPSNPPIDAGTLPTTGTCTVTDDGVTVCTDTSVGTASSAASSSKSKSSSSSAITKPTLKVISPNGGEVWRAGVKKNISFKGNLRAIINISLEWSGGALPIGESVTLDKSKTSTYSWIIPTTLEERSDYKVRIDYKGGQGSDSSDKTFTIKIKK